MRSSRTRAILPRCRSSADQVDLGGGQRLAPGRHAVAVVGAHKLEQAALLRFPRHDARLSGVAPVKGRVFSIEPQSALLLRRPVTGEAALGEQRLDIPAEIDLGGDRCHWTGRKQRQHQPAGTGEPSPSSLTLRGRKSHGGFSVTRS